jgi:hypothetical protein
LTVLRFDSKSEGDFEAGLRRVTDAKVYLLAKILGVPVANLFPGETEVMKAIRNP